MHMAPGSSRRVELLKIGSPEALHHWLGWTSVIDSAAFDEPVAFAIPPKPPTVNSAPFVSAHLHWRIKLSVTARDVDSVVYETDLEVDARRIEDPFDSPEIAEIEKARIGVDLKWLNFRRTDES